MQLPEKMKIQILKVFPIVILTNYFQPEIWSLSSRHTVSKKVIFPEWQNILDQKEL